jgi:hypothetical protein
MELRMNRKLLLTLASAAAGAFMLYGTAQAAPAASGSLDALKTLGVEQSQIEQARCYRRCWRHRGYWHCRRWCRRWW